MKLLKKISTFALGLVALSSLSSCNYNSLVEKDQTVNQAWAQVENQYQRRADLIPNLVNTVKGYAAHEQTTLQNVTDARAGLTKAYQDVTALSGQGAPEDLTAYEQAQAKLKGSLDIYVNAVHEAYPDLKANTNFMALQTQLEGTENRIATERMRYNDAVKDYNTSIKSFPTLIYAGWFGFKERPMFHAEAGAEHAPHVEF